MTPQPTHIAAYRVLAPLDGGTTAPVFLAEDPKTGRRVRISAVDRAGRAPHDPQAAARATDHPNLARIVDVVESDGATWVVAVSVEGTTLEPFCSPDGLLPVETVVAIVAGVAEALDHAHRGGLVHRGIAPCKLVRTEQRAATVIDLGLEPVHGAALAAGTGDGSRESYLSPEQIRDQPVDGRSDLFSLGVVLYELLTGCKPFAGESVSSVVYRVVHEDPRDPTKLDPPVPTGLASFLARALAKSPEARFADGATFAATLREAGAEAQRAAAAPVPPEPPPAATRRPGRPARSSARPFVLGALLLVIAVAALGFRFRDRLRPWFEREPPVVWWETTVRTEPEGLDVLLDGVRLDGSAGGVVRFASTGPFGELSASRGCRTATHRLTPQDAGGDVVLVLDPLRMSWTVDPGLDGADVSVDGEARGKTPAEVDLDLCRDNRLELRAAGFRPAVVELPAGSTPVEARERLFGVALEPVPRGTLRLAKGPVQLVYYLDGQRLESSRTELELELEEGEYTLRYKNDYHFVDRQQKIRVAGGETVTPDLRSIDLAMLVVQAFPSNCKVYVRRPGGDWRYVDETPAKRRVATGAYEVKVVLNPTGEESIREVTLVEGDNPPVRVAFGGSR